jgi:Ca2+-binding EF-hand superfamily protein
MDADNSGKLDADEVAALCKKMGKKLNDKGLQAAMADMDEDGSGEVRRTRPGVQRAG